MMFYVELILRYCRQSKPFAQSYLHTRTTFADYLSIKGESIWSINKIGGVVHLPQHRLMTMFYV